MAFTMQQKTGKRPRKKGDRTWLCEVKLKSG